MPTGSSTRRVAVLILSAALLAASLLGARSADAAENKVMVTTYAWYWEEQESQKVQDPSGTDVATVELPNPFCPGPGGGLGAPEHSCRQGRLPVEVRGADYEEPNKISAVAFDLALVPLNSDVSDFTVTFLEATDEQSRPVNAEGRALQACLVEEFFGEGEARPYKAAPRHVCSKTDPVAKRKPVKGKDERFQYTFDLTEFARDWVDEDGAPVAAIMLYPVEPKDAGPQDAAWRVVLDGSLENEGKSVSARISYTPPPEPEVDLGGGSDDGFDDLGSASTGGFGTTTSTGGFGTSTSVDTPAGEVVAEDTSPSPVAVGENPTSAGEPPVTVNETPWYMWVALLGGLVAFSMVRSVVLESRTGIRPDGVLAQIRRINSERRGGVTAPETREGGRLTPVLAALAGVAGAGRSLARKLPARRRKG